MANSLNAWHVLILVIYSEIHQTKSESKAYIVTWIFGVCKKRNGLRGNFGNGGIDEAGRVGNCKEKFGIEVEFRVGNCAASSGFRRCARGPRLAKGLELWGCWPKIF